MIQQGQVFKLKAKSADGQPLWAYRYRLDGRGSARTRSEASRFAPRRCRLSGRCSSGSAPEGERR